MAVQFPTFQRAPADDYSGIGNVFENMLSGYKISRAPAAIQRQEEQEKYDNLIKAVQAEFARPKAGAELQKLQSDARYASPLAQALLRQRNSAASTSLINAQKQAQTMDLLSSLLRGGAPGDSATIKSPPVDDMPLFGGGGMPSIESLQQPPSYASGSPSVGSLSSPTAPSIKSQPNANEGQSNSSLTYGQVAAASSLLKLPPPKIIDVDGQRIAVTPFGNIPVATGLNQEQTAFKSGLGKYKAKLYGDSVDSVKSYANRGVALDNLINLAQNNPSFMNVTGKINKPITDWFGSPDEQELLGQLQSSSGEITLQVADSLKGSWDGKDQALVDSIKASPNDFPHVFVGKLKAQKLIDTVLQKRSELLAQYLEQNKTPLEASKLAAAQTPLDKYRPIINNLIGKNEYDIQTDKKTGKRYEYINGQWELLK